MAWCLVKHSDNFANASTSNLKTLEIIDAGVEVALDDDYDIRYEDSVYDIPAGAHASTTYGDRYIKSCLSTLSAC
jgi:hypothetical protein